MKCRLRQAVLLMGIAVFFSIYPHKIYAECKPLLVMYGGFGDGKSEIMKNIAKSFRSDIDIEYYHHDEANPSRSYIKRHLERYPSSPVVLVGHSWGGDTAYGVAADWGFKIRLLATLDAVGGRAYPGSPNFTEFRKDLNKPNNVRKWINVWGKYYLGFTKCFIFGGFIWDSTDCIADAGGPWGKQKKATKNIRFKGDHADADGMLRKISSDVESALSCS